MGGWLQSYRATLGVRRYEHDELDGDEVGTHVRQRYRGSGVAAVASSGRAAVGQRRRLVPEPQRSSAIGEEALSPPIDQRGFAGVPLRGAHVAACHVAVRRPRRSHQLRADGGLAGARLHRVVGLARPVAAAGGRQRQLRDRRSAWRARRATLRSKSCISSVRTPATSPSRSAIPIWNPSTASASTCRCAAAPSAFEGELTFFHNDIKDYIFRNPISEEEFAGARRGVRRALRRRGRSRRGRRSRRVPVRRVRRRRQRRCSASRRTPMSS